LEEISGMNIDFSDKDQVAKYLRDLVIHEPQLLPDVVLTLVQVMVMHKIKGQLRDTYQVQLARLEERLNKLSKGGQSSDSSDGDINSDGG